MSWVELAAVVDERPFIDEDDDDNGLPPFTIAGAALVGVVAVVVFVVFML